MLQTDEPRDYVIATGEARTVQQVCETAFEHVGLDWRAHVEVSDRPGRETDPAVRVGDAGRAAADLDWAPTRGFTEIVTEMVEADLDLATSGTANNTQHVLTD
jgi:GDPmannose 4,6-dehydratase